jgi:hypothetical protein
VLPRLPYMGSHLKSIREAPTRAGYRVQRHLPNQLAASVEVEIGDPCPALKLRGRRDGDMPPGCHGAAGRRVLRRRRAAWC